MEWPKFLLVHKSIKWVVDKDNAVLISLVIVYYSYFYASLLKLPSIVSSSGALISAIGLLLTLKHNFLSSVEKPPEAVAKHHNIGNLGSTNMMQNPTYVNPAIIAIKDEYVGILLVLIGGFISGYGGFVPLLC